MSSTATKTEAEVLAEAVRDLNAEAIEFVEACTPTEWAATTVEEGWALPMAGTHIALGHLVIARWVHRVASGQDVSETTEDFVVSNALDARRYSDSSQAQVVDRIRVYGAALERLVRDLSDDQLATSAVCVGHQFRTSDMVRDLAIGHARGHLANMVSAAHKAVGKE